MAKFDGEDKAKQSYDCPRKDWKLRNIFRHDKKNDNSDFNSVDAKTG